MNYIILKVFIDISYMYIKVFIDISYMYIIYICIYEKS